MIIIRNDLNDEVTLFFDEEEITIPPYKTASFPAVEFGKLRLENVVVKIKNNVIKIKGVL